MKPIRELVGRELVWTQPHALQRDFELKDGDEIIATLVFRSLLGSFATAETGNGSWTFKRVGFWQPRVTICVAGTDREIATFRNNTWSAGGTLEMGDGRSYRANTNFWMTTYEFKDEGGESLVRYHKVGGVVHLSSKVEIAPAAAALPELPWLVALGWYLAVKLSDDGGTAAAAAAAG